MTDPQQPYPGQPAPPQQVFGGQQAPTYAGPAQPLYDYNSQPTAAAADPVPAAGYPASEPVAATQGWPVAGETSGGAQPGYGTVPPAYGYGAQAQQSGYDAAPPPAYGYGMQSPQPGQQAPAQYGQQASAQYGQVAPAQYGYAPPQSGQDAAPKYGYNPAAPLPKSSRKGAWILGGVTALVAVAAIAGVTIAMGSSDNASSSSHAAANPTAASAPANPTSDSAAITALTNKLLHAEVAGDTDAVLKMTTGALHDKVATKGLPSSAMSVTLSSVSVGDIVVTGDAATATATAQITSPDTTSSTDVEYYEYQRTSSGWKVSLNPKTPSTPQN